MTLGRIFMSSAIAVSTCVGLATAIAPIDAVAQEKKPNIIAIMGDDIGMWNIGAYHRGLMAGKTPNSSFQMPCFFAREDNWETSEARRSWDSCGSRASLWLFEVGEYGGQRLGPNMNLAL